MELNIPEGINYECTGCGKCCSGWSVPLTQEDYERIAPIDWGALNPDLKNKKLFRALKAHEKLHTPYTHAISPEPSGQCPFLKNNLCFIHSQFGASVKPAICQLFPYSFNETPAGIFATVSFISRGAIYNAGRSLLEQKEYLKVKYGEFQKLFPSHYPNWSHLKLSSNVPLSWSEFLEIDKELLALITEPDKSIEDRFMAGSCYLQSVLVDRLSKGEKAADGLSPKNNYAEERKQAYINRWDKILFLTLYKRYFPNDKQGAKGYGQLSLDLGGFIKGSFNISQFDKLIVEVNPVPWADVDDQVKDLINRFFYSRIFAKLYFGAGFGQLSLIAGFNHLALALALLKLKVRQNTKARQQSKINMDDAVSAIVQLEKSLGELKISPYGAAILELLLGRQQRIERILSLY